MRAQDTPQQHGMAGSGPDSCAAVRVLLRYDRVEAAARLLMSLLHVWDQQVAQSPFKSSFCHMPTLITSLPPATSGCISQGFLSPT